MRFNATNNCIKFSHNYPKLHNQKLAELLAVRELLINDKITQDFLEYDTKTVDGSYYPLKKGRHLQLVFIGDKHIPFCTVRSYSTDKERFYKSNIGEWFKIEVLSSGSDTDKKDELTVFYDNPLPEPRYMKPLSSLPEISYEEIHKSMLERGLFPNSASFPHQDINGNGDESNAFGFVLFQFLCNALNIDIPSKKLSDEELKEKIKALKKLLDENENKGEV